VEEADSRTLVEVARGVRAQVRERFERFAAAEDLVECELTTPDTWRTRFLLAMLEDYGIKAYRYEDQSETTVMIKAPPSFLLKVLNPMIEKMVPIVGRRLEEVIADLLKTNYPECAQGAPKITVRRRRANRR